MRARIVCSEFSHGLLSGCSSALGLGVFSLGFLFCFPAERLCPKFVDTCSAARGAVSDYVWGKVLALNLGDKLSQNDAVCEINKASICSARFQRCWMAKSSGLVLPNRDVLISLVVHSFGRSAFQPFSHVLLQLVCVVSPEEKHGLIGKDTMFRKKKKRKKKALQEQIQLVLGHRSASYYQQAPDVVVGKLSVTF